MFFEGPTIGVNGFSMVFKILRAMVNNGFEVNDGLDVQLNLKSVTLQTLVSRGDFMLRAFN